MMMMVVVVLVMTMMVMMTMMMMVVVMVLVMTLMMMMAVMVMMMAIAQKCNSDLDCKDLEVLIKLPSAVQSSSCYRASLCQSGSAMSGGFPSLRMKM